MKIRAFLNLVLTAMIGLASANVLASDYVGPNAIVRADGQLSGMLLLVYINSSRAGQGSPCADPQHFIHTTMNDANRIAQANRLHSLLLAAQLSGRSVTIWGTGTCEGSYENIAAVRMN